jgi:hypothetical protein
MQCWPSLGDTDLLVITDETKSHLGVRNYVAYMRSFIIALIRSGVNIYCKLDRFHCVYLITFSAIKHGGSLAKQLGLNCRSCLGF